MHWWILAAGVIIFIGRAIWRAHKHPSTKLGVQAAGLGWVTLGHIKDNAGHSNHRVGRGPYEALILFRTGEVQLIQPEVRQPFKDFLEVDRWIREHEQAARETDPEALYIRTVEEVVRALGRLSRLREIEESDELFALSVSMAYTMAHSANVSHKVFGHLMRDAVNHYEQNPALAIAFLDSLVSKWRPAVFEDEDELAKDETADLEDTFHPALDRGVELVRAFLASLGGRTGLSGNGILLRAELLVYAASFIAMKQTGREFYPSEWNTFKAGIENRMLSIEDDGSERSSVENNADGGFTFTHFSSGYRNQMDALDRVIGGGAVRAGPDLPERVWRAIGGRVPVASGFPEMFQKLVTLAATSVLPKLVF